MTCTLLKQPTNDDWEVFSVTVAEVEGNSLENSYSHRYKNCGSQKMGTTCDSAHINRQIVEELSCCGWKGNGDLIHLLKYKESVNGNVTTGVYSTYNAWLHELPIYQCDCLQLKDSLFLDDNVLTPSKSTTICFFWILTASRCHCWSHKGRRAGRTSRTSTPESKCRRVTCTYKRQKRYRGWRRQSLHPLHKDR